MKNLVLLSIFPLAAALPASAALTDNLVAYYNFEETGTAGISNKAAGASDHNGNYLNGTSFGAGAGFAGSAVYAGAEAGATTNRSTLLVGNALNIAKSDASTTAGSGQFSVTTLTSRGTPPTAGDYGTLGTQFAVSAWFYLAPDADNTGTTADILRDFVFESRLNGPDNTAVFDISFGTTDAAGTTYASYVASVTNAANNRSLAAGAWHHVVHSFATSGTDTVMSVYLDGELVGTGTAATTTMDFRGINFGANRSGARIFDGMMDEVGVWNRPLTAEEVAELRQRGLSGVAITASKFAITLAVSPGGGGSVAGGGLYNPGAQVPVSATPNPGYVFAAWEGGFTGQPASFTHTVGGNITATATFGEDTADSDGDGLSNYEEVVVYQTLPNNPDTDGDEIPDGAEVLTTGTNPKTSDAQLVAFVRQNLSAGGAGAIALSPLRIDRNPGTGAVSLFLSVSGSANQTLWQDIDLSQPSVSIVPSGDGWNVSFPAPSNSVDSYILRSGRP
ncbi:LamG-like jellyroll fold domain-containing protein [Haloferula sp. BvORR071]|uniref:LamG-like jellyroll fold domain-containing protein n=1 Tax=Haloferula sp. BvORR071 TaxID=1396141 RepID=UPI0005545A35|nr:LamG-like jellyroll fold domain-containing protein [Haloferula sp. BvORR071]